MTSSHIPLPRSFPVPVDSVSHPLLKQEEEGELCKYCPNSTTRYKRLGIHLNSCHPKEVPPSVILPFSDPLHESKAIKVFKVQRKGYEGLHDPYVYSCPWLGGCSEYFTRQSELKNHWLTSHYNEHTPMHEKAAEMDARNAEALLAEEPEEEVDDGRDPDYNAPKPERKRRRRTSERKPPRQVAKRSKGRLPRPNREPRHDAEPQPVAAPAERTRSQMQKPQEPRSFLIEFLESISTESHDYTQYAHVFTDFDMTSREDFQSAVGYGPAFVDDIGKALMAAGLLPFRWFVIKEELQRLVGGSDK